MAVMARSDARKELLDVLPSKEEMSATIENLRLADDAAAIMMSAAFLDHALEMILKARFRSLSKEEERRMFDSSQNAILGTFSAKIRMVYALDLLTSNVYNDLLLINDMRNVVAHSLHMNVDFTSKHIISDCRKLRSLDEIMSSSDDYRRPSVPSILILETVQRIYFIFTSVGEFTQMMRSSVERRPYAPGPSQRKPRQRNRRKISTGSE
jgi:DNA-binding MltR family transcriptional regulator